MVGQVSFPAQLGEEHISRDDFLEPELLWMNLQTSAGFLSTVVFVGDFIVWSFSLGYCCWAEELCTLTC